MSGARLRVAAVVLILASQAAAIVYARFAPTRYFSWAPFDQIAVYRIDVEQQARPLTSREIDARYRMPSAGRQQRSIHHVIGAIEQYERTLGRDDNASVRVTYSINGRPEEVWSFTR